MSFFRRIFGKDQSQETKGPPNIHMEIGSDGQVRTFLMEFRCAGCGMDLNKPPRAMEVTNMTSFGKGGKRIYTHWCEDCKKKLDAGLLKMPE
jgi:hypothetical protein